MQIGNLILTSGGLCKRCNGTRINQLTAEMGLEPLQTLALYRQIRKHLGDNGVYFGMNFNHQLIGDEPYKISIGDEVRVLEWAN